MGRLNHLLSRLRVFVTPQATIISRLKNAYKIKNNKFSPKGQILIAQAKQRAVCVAQAWGVKGFLMEYL